MTCLLSNHPHDTCLAHSRRPSPQRPGNGLSRRARCWLQMSGPKPPHNAVTMHRRGVEPGRRLMPRRHCRAAKGVERHLRTPLPGHGGQLTMVGPTTREATHLAGSGHWSKQRPQPPRQTDRHACDNQSILQPCNLIDVSVWAMEIYIYIYMYTAYTHTSTYILDIYRNIKAHIRTHRGI